MHTIPDPGMDDAMTNLMYVCCFLVCSLIELLGQCVWAFGTSVIYYPPDLFSFSLVIIFKLLQGLTSTTQECKLSKRDFGQIVKLSVTASGR